MATAGGKAGIRLFYLLPESTEGIDLMLHCAVAGAGKAREDVIGELTYYLEGIAKGSTGKTLFSGVVTAMVDFTAATYLVFGSISRLNFAGLYC